MKHKHCEVIKAWADGAQIQVKSEDNAEWQDISSNQGNPAWIDFLQYRVKPEPKQLWARAYRVPNRCPTALTYDSSPERLDLPGRLDSSYVWAGPAVLVWEEK